jgi:hypothetical protein
LSRATLLHSHRRLEVLSCPWSQNEDLTRSTTNDIRKLYSKTDDGVPGTIMFVIFS